MRFNNYAEAHYAEFYGLEHGASAEKKESGLHSRLSPEDNAGTAHLFSAGLQPDALDMTKLLIFFAGDQSSTFSHLKFSMLDLGESLGRMNGGLAKMRETLSRMSDIAVDARIASWITEMGRSGEELACTSGEYIGLLLDAVHHYQSLPEDSRDSVAQGNITVMHSIIEQTILKFKITNACIDNVNYALSLLGSSLGQAAVMENALAVKDSMQAVSDAFQLFHDRGSSPARECGMA